MLHDYIIHFLFLSISCTQGQQMVTSVALRKWVIVVPGRDEASLANLVRTMQNVARPLNFEIAGEMDR